MTLHSAQKVGGAKGRESHDCKHLLPSCYGYVSAKADVLAFLIGLQGRMATVQEIAEAAGYSKVAVRNVTSDMALARFVQETDGYPARYHVHIESWTALLGLRDKGSVHEGEPVVWRQWASLFTYLAQIHLLLSVPQSAYVLSSRARDILEEHQVAFSRNQIIVPDPNDYQGASYLEGLSLWSTNML